MGSLPVDHKRRGFMEKLPQRRDDFGRQVRLGQGRFHELDPAVAAALVDVERRVPHAQSRMAALLRIRERSTEATLLSIRVASPCLGTISNDST